MSLPTEFLPEHEEFLPLSAERGNITHTGTHTLSLLFLLLPLFPTSATLPATIRCPGLD